MSVPSSVIELLHHNRDTQTLIRMLFDPLEFMSPLEIVCISKHVDSVQDKMPQYKAQIKVGGTLKTCWTSAGLKIPSFFIPERK